MKTDEVVYVFHDSDWRPARVVSVLSGTVEVETIASQRLVYSQRRIARISDHKAVTFSALETYIRQVEALRNEIDLQTVWELFVEEDDNRSYTLDELAECALPSSGAAADDATAWALFIDSIYFKQAKDGSFKRNTATSVEERIRRQASEDKARHEFAAMSQWLRNLDGDRPPEAEIAIEALKQLVLFCDDPVAAGLGRKLLKACFPTDSRADQWIAWSLLRKLNIWTEDENLSIYRAGLRIEFPKSVLDGGKELEMQAVDLSRYVDYRDLQTVAIDDAFTTEVDDALAVKKHDDGSWTVYVFITDVAEWIPVDHSVDVEARRRGATLYLPEGKVTMLPLGLGEDKASLVESQDRGALAFIATIDKHGALQEFAIEEALIRVDARITYHAVEDVLTGRQSGDFDELIQSLAELADRLRKVRRDSGALIMDRLEVSIHLDSERQIHVDSYFTDLQSRYLVSEMMILACTHAAQWCRERSVPAVYRAQTAPEDMPSIPERALAPAELNRVLKKMRRAEMCSTPRPHAGLGVPCYTQVTSPLRRYQDLVMHRQIKGYLRTGRAPYSKGKIMEVFNDLDGVGGTYGAIERESRRYWLIKSMIPRIGEKVAVEVVRKAGRRFVVQLLENGLQTLWSPQTNVKAGDRPEPILRVAEPRKDRLILE